MKPLKYSTIPALALLLGGSLQTQAGVLAYESFGDGVNDADVNSYAGTTSGMQTGLIGTWTGSTAPKLSSPPLTGTQVGVQSGYAPDSNGGVQHAVKQTWWEVSNLTRTMTTPVNLSVDGTYYMSFFAASNNNHDFVAQVGLSNATQALMAGNVYAWGGLTAYFGANSIAADTNQNGTGLGAFSWGDKNAFFVITITKTNSGSTDDVAVQIDAYDFGNNVAVNISGGPQRTRTVNLTGVTGSFTDLKFKLDGGGGVTIDEIRLGQSLDDVTTGGIVPDSDFDDMLDVWEITYFGNLSHDGSQGAVNGDADGLTDYEEFIAGTNPTLADTDGDSLSDGAEVLGGGNLFDGAPTNPLLADTDGDKVTDYDEVHGTLNTSFSLEATDPNLADTDFDGVKDYKELVYHSNPNDSGSVPTPALFDLISNTLQNGSFETKNGGTQIDAKIQGWDVVGNDIDNWTQLAGPAGDSGVENYGPPAVGGRAGYFQSGNSAYNLTNNIAAAGSVYACTWKQLNQGGNTISVKLVYKNASNVIVEIPESLATTNTNNGVGDLLYQIPAGSPAIGFPIGISMGSTGWWIDVDEVALNIAATGDDDGDGLLNLWEVANGLNPNSSVGTNGASGDPDGDGYNNLAEQAAGSNPQLITSIPNDIDSDGLGDAWETTNFGGLSNPLGAPGLDPDGDKDTNLVEFTNSSNPNDKFSFYSNPADTVPNSWEMFYGISTSATGATDSDLDGLPNEQEFILDTNPSVGDTDSDGRSDGNEVNGIGAPSTNPLLADTDGDTLLDGAEVTTHGTDPTKKDTDADGYNDNVEVTAGSLPLVASSTPLTITGATVLIDQLHNNGSFELLAGATSTLHAAHWDTDPDGDVDNWALWNAAVGGPSTADNNSGTVTSATATAGTRIGFLEGGNAAYNQTAHVIAVGESFTYTWDWVNAFRGNATAQLAYLDGGNIVVITGTNTTNAPNTTGLAQTGLGISWTATAGHPAIGKVMVMTITGAGNYPEVDNFVLRVGGVVNSDSDSDGMTDTWETTYFGNIAQTATGDFDDDGTNNLTEFRLGLVPNSGSSGFVATRSAAGLLTWPSVAGVTFRIERSTSLASDSWTTLEAAFPGTAGTASYTDPSPPAGKAFYKIGLNP